MATGISLCDLDPRSACIETKSKAGGTATPRSVEIEVVGAGILGLSIAYECARRGASTRVVDKASPAHSRNTRQCGVIHFAGGSASKIDSRERTVSLSLSKHLQCNNRQACNGNLHAVQVPPIPPQNALWKPRCHSAWFALRRRRAIQPPCARHRPPQMPHDG